MIPALILAALLAAPDLPAVAPAEAGAPSLPVTEDIRDVRAPVSIPAPTPWATYASVTLAIAIAASAAVLWRRRSRSLAAHERAFATLEEARALGEPRAFATAVSGAVRRYIEERFAVPAGKRTTAEFLEAVAFDPPPLMRDHLAPLKEMLDFSDRAKFGGFLLAPAEMEGMHACAWGFVATTRPAEKGRAR